jgi:hypothetical protein
MDEQISNLDSNRDKMVIQWDAPRFKVTFNILTLIIFMGMK